MFITRILAEHADVTHRYRYMYNYNVRDREKRETEKGIEKDR